MTPTWKLKTRDLDLRHDDRNELSSVQFVFTFSELYEADLVEEALPSHRSYMNSSLFHVWFDTDEHHWNKLCKMSLWHDTEQAIFTTADARSSQATGVSLSSDDES